MVRKILLDKTTSYEEADRLIHALDTLINSN